MVEMYVEPLMTARYHFETARRMFKSYYDFEEKRFLVGVINEGARAVSHLIRAFLIKEGVRGKNPRRNLKIFMDDVALKYMDDVTRGNLFRALEVQRAQSESPIEFARKDKIILLINGKYRFLTANRLKEFLDSIEIAIKSFG